MNPLVYHIVSGQSFFTGTCCVVFAVWLSTRKRLNRFRGLPLSLGLVLVLLSSTPLPLALYVAIVVSTLDWLGSRWIEPVRSGSRVLVVICWAVALSYEVAFSAVPMVSAVDGDATLLIIGDSVTAGLGEDPDERTWPTLLAADHRLSINDQSHVGETAASALRRVQGRFSAGTVLIEVGGNDLLGSTSAAKFERDLDALIREFYGRKSTHQIIMFELPLPPFAHRYGYAQRRVAAKYDVKLIPKRVLLSVLAGEQSTSTAFICRRLGTIEWLMS